MRKIWLGNSRKFCANSFVIFPSERSSRISRARSAQETNKGSWRSWWDSPTENFEIWSWPCLLNLLNIGKREIKAPGMEIPNLFLSRTSTTSTSPFVTSNSTVSRRSSSIGRLNIWQRPSNKDVTGRLMQNPSLLEGAKASNRPPILDKAVCPTWRWVLPSASTSSGEARRVSNNSRGLAKFPALQFWKSGASKEIESCGLILGWTSSADTAGISTHVSNMEIDWYWGRSCPCRVTHHYV